MLGMQQEGGNVHALQTEVNKHIIPHPRLSLS